MAECRHLLKDRRRLGEHIKTAIGHENGGQIRIPSPESPANSHRRWANQEISRLLKQPELFDTGLTLVVGKYRRLITEHMNRLWGVSLDRPSMLSGADNFFVPKPPITIFWRKFKRAKGRVVYVHTMTLISPSDAFLRTFHGLGYIHGEIISEDANPCTVGIKAARVRHDGTRPTYDDQFEWLCRRTINGKGETSPCWDDVVCVRPHRAEEPMDDAPAAAVAPPPPPAVIAPPPAVEAAVAPPAGGVVAPSPPPDGGAVAPPPEDVSPKKSRRSRSRRRSERAAKAKAEEAANAAAEASTDPPVVDLTEGPAFEMVVSKKDKQEEAKKRRRSDSLGHASGTAPAQDANKRPRANDPTPSRERYMMGRGFKAGFHWSERGPWFWLNMVALDQLIHQCKTSRQFWKLFGSSGHKGYAPYINLESLALERVPTLANGKQDRDRDVISLNPREFHVDRRLDIPACRDYKTRNSDRIRAAIQSYLGVTYAELYRRGEAYRRNLPGVDHNHYFSDYTDAGRRAVLAAAEQRESEARAQERAYREAESTEEAHRQEGASDPGFRPRRKDSSERTPRRPGTLPPEGSGTVERVKDLAGRRGGTSTGHAGQRVSPAVPPFPPLDGTVEDAPATSAPAGSSYAAAAQAEASPSPGGAILQYCTWRLRPGKLWKQLCIEAAYCFPKGDPGHDYWQTMATTGKAPVGTGVDIIYAKAGILFLRNKCQTGLNLLHYWDKEAGAPRQPILHKPAGKKATVRAGPLLTETATATLDVRVVLTRVDAVTTSTPVTLSSRRTTPPSAALGAPPRTSTAEEVTACAGNTTNQATVASTVRQQATVTTATISGGAGPKASSRAAPATASSQAHSAGSEAMDTEECVDWSDPRALLRRVADPLLERIVTVPAAGYTSVTDRLCRVTRDELITIFGRITEDERARLIEAMVPIITSRTCSLNDPDVSVAVMAARKTGASYHACISLILERAMAILDHLLEVVLPAIGEAITPEGMRALNLPEDSRYPLFIERIARLTATEVLPGLAREAQVREEALRRARDRAEAAEQAEQLLRAQLQEARKAAHGAYEESERRKGILTDAQNQLAELAEASQAEQLELQRRPDRGCRRSPLFTGRGRSPSGRPGSSGSRGPR